MDVRPRKAEREHAAAASKFIGSVVIGTGYCIIVAIITCIAAVAPFSEAVGYKWGESACYYATDAGCAPLYQKLFLGGESMRSTFFVFAFVAAANTLFVVFKAASYATVDFDFMCGVSLASLVVVFVPTLLIAIYAFDAAPAALLVAMYAPHLALVPVFGGRLIYNARRMLRGEAGPWNEYDKTAAASAKLSDSMSAQDGVASLHSGQNI